MGRVNVFTSDVGIVTDRFVRTLGFALLLRLPLNYMRRFEGLVMVNDTSSATVQNVKRLKFHSKFSTLYSKTRTSHMMT